MERWWQIIIKGQDTDFCIVRIYLMIVCCWCRWGVGVQWWSVMTRICPPGELLVWRLQDVSSDDVTGSDQVHRSPLSSVTGEFVTERFWYWNGTDLSHFICSSLETLPDPTFCCHMRGLFLAWRFKVGTAMNDHFIWGYVWEVSSNRATKILTFVLY